MAGRDFYVLCSDHKILVDIAIKSSASELRRTERERERERERDRKSVVCVPLCVRESERD